MLAHTSKLIQNFATSKSDNEVEEAQKAGYCLRQEKTLNGASLLGKSGEVIEERLQRQ